MQHRSTAVAATVALTIAAAANASLIRPTSATATSEFSGSYVIANAINGSGLPADFGPGDSHATYTTNNHWTTRANQTIGQSATFLFDTPQDLAIFYMWAHRSNNIATNPHYAVTRFDLVFRDSASNELATLTDLVGVPNVLTAQQYDFPVVSGVSSVQFIVRATANNNSSPYTGLAEVAFGIPAPGTLAAAAGLLAFAGRRRR